MEAIMSRRDFVKTAAAAAP
ncbi:MAG: twin-arginine translocation signal domain-containing protein [Kiritimatiellae bacterium]|nr:twin-arginine translocation signal domain-containing protein [Kiritimatiellia bacterium]